MNRIFIGVDSRQPLAWTVLSASIWRHAKEPVSITPLCLQAMPIKRRGLTEFTFSRFLVPYLCEYKGTALFLDADMVVTGDISEVFRLPVAGTAVHISTQQPRFEWSSAMFFHNAHSDCQKLTPAYIEHRDNNPLDMEWTHAKAELPAVWNRAVGYVDTHGAKLFHYTMGIPCWPETTGKFHEESVWHDAHEHATATCGFSELMGKSVHVPVLRASNAHN